ncbi:MAG: hypothetical protein VXV96_13600 [Bdellovibrionota bacterium]|nr:hypothetical protein [Bdellovibrionota bacterium]
METETLSFAEDLCPKDIVTQLLEIAKAHDALDEIGGATSWRWQEGIISRMPKTKTVIKVLKKAFDSDNPVTWYNNTNGSLKRFIQNNMLSGFKDLSTLEPKDIYETLFVILVQNARGANFDELVVNLAVLKFLKLNSCEDEDSFYVDKELALKIYGEWAVKEVSNLIIKLNLTKNEDGNYISNQDVQFTSEKMLIHRMEIQALRFKVVGASSKVDMWRALFTDLSFDEMIHMEWMILDFYENFKVELNKVRTKEGRSQCDRIPRVFSFTTTTLPLEGLGVQ